MMFYLTSTYIKVVFTILLSISIISCKDNENEQKDLTFILQTSFGHIYLAKHGLEYPYTEDHLNRCIEQNDKPCLDVYHSVIEGKKTIISLKNNKTLDITLDIIENACVSKTEEIANYSCYGGIMSLYFYDSEEQDAKILSRIKKYPKKIRSLIFNNEFYWFRNRPDINIWVNYITEADFELSDGNQKHFITDMFRKKIDEDDHKPWVLR